MGVKKKERGKGGLAGERETLGRIKKADRRRKKKKKKRASRPSWAEGKTPAQLARAA